MLKQRTATFFIVFSFFLGISAKSFAFTPNSTLAGIAPNTAYRLADFSCTRNAGDTSSVCLSVGASSQFTYDPDHHKIWFFGGGHSAIFTDVMFQFDPDTLAWTEKYQPTACTEFTESNLNRATAAWISGKSGPYPRPLSRHTYNGVIVPYGTGLNEVILMSRTTGGGGCVFSNDILNDTLFLAGRIAHYSITNNSWSFSATAQGSGAPDYGAYGYSNAFDPVSGKIIIVRDLFAVYDPVTRVKTSYLNAHNGDFKDAQGNPLQYDMSATWGHLVYFPPNDKFYYMGPKYGGFSGTQVIEINFNRNNPASTTFTLLSPTGTGSPFEEPGWDYDSVNHVIGGGLYNNVFYVFNPLTRAWSSPTVQDGTPGTIGSHTIAYDPVNNGYVIMNTTGQIWFYRYGAGSLITDTTPPTIPTNVNATAVSSSQINLSWGNSTDNIGVSGYKIFRAGTLLTSVTGTTYQNTGLSPSTTYSYTVAAYDAVGNTSGQSTIASAATQAVTTPPPTSGGADFQTRCAAPGVIRCWGFDSASELTSNICTASASWCNTQRMGAGYWGLTPVLDTSVKASGGGSIKLTIPSDADAIAHGCTPRCSDSSGSWSTNLMEDLTGQIGQGQSLFVQLRVRFSSAALGYMYLQADKSLTGPKIIDIGEGDQVANGFRTGSCTQIETVVNTSSDLVAPGLYHGCGRFENFQFTYPLNGNYISMTHHDSGPWCLWPGDPQGGCHHITANEWVTLKIRIDVGTWGTLSSRIRFWYKRDNEAAVLIEDSIDAYPSGFDIRNSCGVSACPDNPPCPDNGCGNGGSGTYPNAKFGKIWLLSYITNRDVTATNNSEQYIWVDELIASTQDIADPGSGTTNQSQPPAPPTGLTLR